MPDSPWYYNTINVVRFISNFAIYIAYLVFIFICNLIYYIFKVSVIQYGKPTEIKKDINERFKERFPNLRITLSKLRR